MSASNPPLAGHTAEAPRLAWAIFAASLLLAATDAVGIAIGVPIPSSGVGLRVAHHVYDAAEVLGVGAVAALLVGLYERYVRLPSLAAFGLAAAGAVALLHDTVGDHLRRGVEISFGGHFATAGYIGYLLGLGLATPWAYAMAVRASRHPTRRLAVVGVAAAALFADQAFLRDDYQGMHAVIACGAAILGGAAVASSVRRWWADPARSTRGRALLGALALVGATGLVLPPPNAVRFELFRLPCATAPWLLARALWSPPALHAPVQAAANPWSRDRSGDHAVPPTQPRLLPDDVVVALITVDAVRADAVSDPANAALFPTLTELARVGVVFTEARAAGSQTAVSLSALFSGRPFSEQLWTEHGSANTRYLYPAEDPSTRFPELLTAHGVTTAAFEGLSFLAGDYGVVRGFHEEAMVVRGARHATSVELVDRMVGRIRHLKAGPAFLYTHLMDPHAPYDRGRTDGTERERYLSEIAVADAQIARVWHALEARFPRRWVLFVSADHGEAFGEHGIYEHGKSLYEELLRVPMIVASPLLTARRIDQRVSLVDLGPTILDAFGMETPATFLGQSLAPLLAGADVVLTRPLFAEGRLRRELVSADGLVTIEDERRKVVEVYDLTTDPGETRNLFDAEPARADGALATLRAFFAAHTRTQGGYVPPFTP
jgi:arylsulfatase A-like enzyme